MMTTAAGHGSIAIDRVDDTVRVTMVGEIDVRTVTESARARLTLAETENEIVVDTAAVTFIDSVGLTVLLELRQYAGAGVRLLHPPQRLSHLLDATGITGLFVIDD